MALSFTLPRGGHKEDITVGATAPVGGDIEVRLEADNFKQSRSDMAKHIEIIARWLQEGDTWPS